MNSSEAGKLCRVAIFHDIVEHLVIGQSEFVLDELGNPQIGLVWNQHIDILWGKVVLL